MRFNFATCSKALGVLAILFHLSVILFLPNRESYLNLAFQNVFLPYANIINMNTAWQFFSPDPGPANYLLMSIYAGDQLLAEEYLPPEKDDFFFRQSYNRRIATMRLLIKDPEIARRLLVPWLCQRFPKATSLKVQKITMAVPSLESVRQGNPLNDLSTQHADDFISDHCEHYVEGVE